MNILLLFWFFYGFFLLASFECNLRAILMKANYEEFVDDEFDMIRMEKNLYLPLGSHYPDLFKNSPREVQRR